MGRQAIKKTKISNTKKYKSDNHMRKLLEIETKPGYAK